MRGAASGAAPLSRSRKDRNVAASSRNDPRADLQRRRRAILETAQRADAELETLRATGRAREFEEGAQKARETEILSRLGESQRLEIARIDEALERLAAGTYGTCADCGEAIEERRLSALPHASRCAGCAARAEGTPSPG